MLSRKIYRLFGGYRRNEGRVEADFRAFPAAASPDFPEAASWRLLRAFFTFPAIRNSPAVEEGLLRLLPVRYSEIGGKRRNEGRRRV